MKKSALTFIVAASFIGLAVFGFVDAFPGAGHLHRAGCIASRAMQTSCPENDTFASLAFHLDALRWFSTAEVGVALLLALSMAVAAAVLFGAEKPALAAALRTPAAARRASQEAVYPAARKFINWLSLFEKRDPASFA